MKWIKGRQGTGYEKLKLFQLLCFDCYLIRYKEGDVLPFHTDPVEGRKHYRLNFLLKRPESGGNFLIKNGEPKIVNERVVFMRSDITPHAVSKVRKGSRLVLTFGAAI